MTTRGRARTACVAVFVLALAALVFVDCFNAPATIGWTDGTDAPHLSATLQRTTTGRAANVVSAPVRAALPSLFTLSLCLLLLGIVAAGPRSAPHLVGPARPPSRSPPFART